MLQLTYDKPSEPFPERVVITLRLTHSERQKLSALLVRSGHESMEELVLDSFGHLDWSLSQVEEGGIIAALYEQRGTTRYLAKIPENPVPSIKILARLRQFLKSEVK